MSRSGVGGEEARARSLAVDILRPLGIFAIGQSSVYMPIIDRITAALLRREVARPLAEWNEEIGDVLWWKFPISEPPYVGTPNDLGQTVEVTLWAHSIDKLMRDSIGGWPGYHTHWTPLSLPLDPIASGEG